jgi:hypothetical protein
MYMLDSSWKRWSNRLAAALLYDLHLACVHGIGDTTDLVEPLRPGSGRVTAIYHNCA